MPLWRKALLCLGALLVASPAAAADYLQQILQTARGHALSRERAWHALLHYHPRLFAPGVRSQIDSESFFLAPGGKTDPEAELEATLASFFRPAGPASGEHPQCTFPARYHWLKQELDFHPDRLPEQPCPRLEAWMAELDPAGVTLVFASSYLNNPASMFGHTLLRIDPSSEDERTRLLAYTVGFAADTQRAKGPVFAFRGLTGGYPGRFSIAPYYLKVKAYGDVENRDIWEYRLALTPAEVRRMLFHVWELGPAYFDYFFLDENCSYQLLGLLEAARPELRLTEQFPLWAIPADTVRAVTDAAGLLERVEFRPSRRAVLEQRALALNDWLQELAKGMGEGKIGTDAEELRALSRLDEARMLELAADYSAYLAGSEPGATDSHRTELLRARSRLDAMPQTPRVEPSASRPDQGHSSSRAAIGYGWEDRSRFVQLEYRPAYHDLLDPPGGYARGGELQFLNTVLRYEPDDGRLGLERLDLAEIVSAAPGDRFTRTTSWRARAGVARRNFANRDRELTGAVAGGLGASRSPWPGVLFSLFGEAEAVFSPRIPDGVGPGLGARATALWDGWEAWRVRFSASALELYAGRPETSYDIALEQRLSISSRIAVRVDVYRRRDLGDPLTGTLLGVMVYF